VGAIVSWRDLSAATGARSGWSPPERERVTAYDRLRAGRDRLPAEDARVLGLVARGARALPAQHRERLQSLSGKAIAAALGSGGQPAEAPRR
jgi:hypothetical protein